MITKKTLRLLIFSALLLSSSRSSLARDAQSAKKKIPSLPDLVDRDKASVVKVSCLYPHSPQGTTGTGFFINKDGLVVTAFHVINHPFDLLTIDLPQPSFMTANGNSFINGFSGISAIVVAVDVDHDLVLLKPETNPLSPAYKPIPILESSDGQRVLETFKGVPVSFEMDKLRDGDPVFTSGYPLNMGILITTAGIVSSSSPVDADIPAHRLRNVYFADMHVNHGNSGGPLFSASSGRAVGMIDAFEPADVETRVLAEENTRNSGGESANDQNGTRRMLLQYNSGIGIIIPAVDIVEFLKRNGVAVAPSRL
jgi:S1-C subfamily serine protease